jgi:hypothetical protein
MHIQTTWRIVKALVFVTDYLIVHEWIHLLETKHTLHFWNIVSDDFRRACVYFRGAPTTAGGPATPSS